MGFLDLSWHPGECQADFGQVDVRYRGVVTRMRHFVLDFPYSNIGPSQLMPGENAECTCQALRNLFEWLGGVPERIVYDNAAGVGRKWFDRIRLTRPVPGVPGALRVRVHVLQPVLGTREGRGRGQGRGRAPQAVRAGARRMEPRQLQPAPSRPLPRTGGQGPLQEGREPDRPVRRGPKGAAAPARQAVRRGHVDEDEGRQIRKRHRPGPPPVRGRTRTRRP